MPRLFVAVNFSEEITSSLFNAVLYLKNHSTHATPSRKENLHLTLAFIGETPKVKNAVSALKRIDAAPFDLTLEGFGDFSSEDGKICFAKTKDSSSLNRLAKTVRAELISYGFQPDSKPFVPHITLCRQFSPSSSFNSEDMCNILSQKTTIIK